MVLVRRQQFFLPWGNLNGLPSGLPSHSFSHPSLPPRCHGYPGQTPLQGSYLGVWCYTYADTGVHVWLDNWDSAQPTWYTQSPPKRPVVALPGAKISEPQQGLPFEVCDFGCRGHCLASGSNLTQWYSARALSPQWCLAGTGMFVVVTAGVMLLSSPW